MLTKRSSTKTGSMRSARIALLSVPAIYFLLSSFAVSAELKKTYPRIGAYEIAGTKKTVDPEYRQALSKHDIVILGMWRNWSATDLATNEMITLRDVVVDIKRRAAVDNREILVGKYTMYMESGMNSTSGSAGYDKFVKLNSETGPGYRINNDWWARNKDGENTSSYRGNWNTNITEHVKRDANGDTYPEWAARRDFDLFFKDVPELDIWFIDNWFYRPRVRADWDGDGDNDDTSSATVRRDYRKGLINALNRARELAPDRIFIGNVDGSPREYVGMLTEPDYQFKLSALYESAIGKSYSQETWGTWESMMEQYQTTLNNAKDRLLIMTVTGDANDFAQMRYGLASCLMDDGYYYYTTVETEYRSALWFDEFDVDLGQAIDPPQFVPWQNGVYRRRFENGIALVNPKGNGRRTVQLGDGYFRIDGTQDRSVNNGQAASSVTLEERDGIILLSDQVLRAPRPKPPSLQ